MDFSLFDNSKAGIQTATAVGSFVTLLITRKYGWAYALTLFVVGQVTAFYWTLPVAGAFGLSMAYYGPIGFFIGAVGMLLWGAVITLGQSLMDDPLAVAIRIWKTWRGGDKE